MGAGGGQSSGRGLAPCLLRGCRGHAPPLAARRPRPSVVPIRTTTPGPGYPAGPLGTTPLTLCMMLTLLYFSVLGFTFSTKLFRLRM